METNRRILKIIVILVILGCMSHCGLYVGKYIQAKKVYTELMQNCTAETEGAVTNTESYTVRYKKRIHGTRYRKNMTKKHYIVTYEYTAEGKKYSDEFETKLQYAKDDTVKVHYDPNAPAASYAGNQPYPYHHDCIGMICAGPVLMCAVLVAVKRRNAQQE